MHVHSPSLVESLERERLWQLIASGIIKINKLSNPSTGYNVIHYTFVRNFHKCWLIFKFFRRHILREICNKTHATIPSKP